MRGSCSRPAAVLLAVAAAVAGARVGVRASALREPLVAGPKPLRAWAAEGAACRKVLGDRGYVAMLQHVGEAAYARDGGRALARLADETTDCDPRQGAAYAFGGGALMWLCNAPDAACRLLEKGIAYNPREGRLRLYLAAFVYRRSRDLGREIAALETIALDPRAPAMTRRILANAYEKSGNLGRARTVWRWVLERSGDPGEAAWAQRKLAGRGERRKP